MSDTLRLCALGVAAALAVTVLRRADRDLGTVSALAAGLMMLLVLTRSLSDVVDCVSGLARQSGMGQELYGALLKMLGVAFLSEYAAQICRDAGEEGLAQKTALAGKMMLLTVTVPLVSRIGQTILSLLPSS